MNLTVDFRRALFGIGGGIAVFWLMKKVFLDKDTAMVGEIEKAAPVPSDDDIEQAILAYQMAVENGENHKALMDLNTDLAKEFSVNVRVKADGSFVAYDLSGKQLKSV